MPFFQSRNLKSFMKSNFFCQIISETSLIFVYHDIKRGDFFEKVLEAKKRWGECWIGYDFRWSFTSGGKYYFKLFRTCWRKILRKRKFNSFQFHFKKDFWKLYNYTPTSTFLILKSYFSETHSCAVCERAFFTSKELERHQYKKRHWG